jgi:hypothetical protein
VKRRPARGDAPPVDGRLLFFALLLGGGAAIAGGDVGVLALAPAVVIALVVARRRYPGAQLLVAMRTRTTRPLRRRGLAPMLGAGRSFLIAPRGGLLLARSLANRPPPALLPAR